ncbi:MAG TPA: HigA family addiction module antitoxin [Pyrinomonadaceae bacterium]|nr:HigA family addiction module antitoxin [Pyrinomonadaceae bacterium]
MLNNRKRRPTHPGELLRVEILPETGLTQSELARRLNISRRTLNEIINERRAVTPDVALRLARAFDTTPELWLNLQQAVDVWEAYEANRSAYVKIKPLNGKQAA